MPGWERTRLWGCRRSVELTIRVAGKVLRWNGRTRKELSLKSLAELWARRANACLIFAHRYRVDSCIRREPVANDIVFY